MQLRSLLFLSLCGCLTSTHVLPYGELQRLASLPPEQRGREVRVVQGFTGAEEPPERVPPVSAGAVIVVTPAPSYGYGYGYGPAGYGGHGGWAPGWRPSAKSMKEEAKWWLVIAGITAVGLAVTEGMRFDGWAELSPMHPVHMFGPAGEWSWVPLAQLTPEMAAWARKSFVRAEEGPFRELRRAPLDRVGATYSLLLGAGQVPAYDGDERAGFLGHIQLGYFFTQQVGALLDIGLAWRTDQNLPDQDRADVFHSRYAFELQGMLLDVGSLHAGLYGQVGMAYRFEDFPDGTGADRSSLLYGGGAQLQLELTTRMALTVRAGVDRLGNDTAAELTGGISIY